jgi:hypothetical protein
LFDQSIVMGVFFDKDKIIFFIKKNEFLNYVKI